MSPLGRNVDHPVKHTAGGIETTQNRQHQGWVATLVANIREGTFPLKPRGENCTVTCDYSEMCRISQSRPAVEKKTWQLPLPLAEPEAPAREGGRPR